MSTTNDPRPSNSLVTRLRGRKMRLHADDYCLMQEAADTIERQAQKIADPSTACNRADDRVEELTRERDEADSGLYEGWERAEIKRLRAAMVPVDVIWQMMYRLADMLDSDDFNNIEAIVQSAGVPFPPLGYDGRPADPRSDMPPKA